MTEAAVVNLFLVVRVFLLGGIFLMFPRVTRKGLVFGTYVGEAVADGAAARELLHRWSRGVLISMALSLLVGLGISFAGWPVPGNLTGTAVMLLSAPVLYVRMFRAARGLAPPGVARQGEVASASLAENGSRSEVFAKSALVVCELAGLATLAFVVIRFPGLPAQVKTFANLFGRSDELVDKSLVALLYAPVASMLLSGSFAAVAVLMAGAKRSVRGGSGSRSAAAQEAYNAIQVQTFSGMALFICLLLTLFSVQVVRIAEARTESLGAGLLWACIAMILFSLGSLVRILRGSGQGGSRLEEASAETPLTGGLADNAHWIWGLFYVNKEDPSVLVESRFGIGYALNLGNAKALLYMAAFLAIWLALIALPLAGVVR